MLFKVSWDAEETHDVGSRYPTARTIPVGTTLAINWETKEILARLTNASPVQQDITSRDLKDTEIRENEYVNQKSDRDVFIKQLVEQGILKRNKSALDHEGKPLLSAIQAEVSNGRMRIRGTGKLFHIIDRREEP